MTDDTTPITCHVFTQRLMEFLEGDVEDATRAALDAHARRCAECGALLGDLRRVTTEATRLPTLTPAHDLWGDIAARLQTPVVPLGAARRRPWYSRMVYAGLAAAVVLAAGVGYETTHRTPTITTPVPAATVAATTQRPATRTLARTDSAVPRVAVPGPSRHAVLAANRAADASPAAVEKTYDLEIADLRAVLDARRSHLDSATVTVIEKNLAVIDSAIAQCRTALSRDPASSYLIQSFSQSLDTKVQLLRTAAGLPAST